MSHPIPGSDPNPEHYAVTSVLTEPQRDSSDMWWGEGAGGKSSKDKGPGLMKGLSLRQREPSKGKGQQEEERGRARQSQT